MPSFYIFRWNWPVLRQKCSKKTSPEEKKSQNIFIAFSNSTMYLKCCFSIYFMGLLLKLRRYGPSKNPPKYGDFRSNTVKNAKLRINISLRQKTFIKIPYTGLFIFIRSRDLCNNFCAHRIFAESLKFFVSPFNADHCINYISTYFN